MDNDAVIDEIIHEIMMMFVSVNAKNSPAISPVKDTSASCIPSIIDDLESNVFAIAIKIAYIYCILPQAKNLNLFMVVILFVDIFISISIMTMSVI